MRNTTAVQRASARLAGLRLLLGVLLLAALPMVACAAPWRGEVTPAPTASVTQTPVSDLTSPAANTPAAPVNDDATAFVELLPSAVESFNPVLTTQPEALALQRLLLPSLVALDPATGAVQPALAESWVWSPDNRILTMTLRSGLAWSDGAPITSRDAAFTLAAVASAPVSSPWAPQFAAIEQVSLPEPDTLVLRQRAPDCALLPLLRLPLLPSHLFAADFGDLRTAPWNSAPSVSAGPFRHLSGAPGGEFQLVPTQDWPGGSAQVNPLIVRAEADPALRLQAVSNGSAQHAADLPADAAGQIGALPGGPQVQIVDSDGMSMLVMNLADPAAPQPGLAPSGVLQPQAPHPVLAELNVREAIARGVDWTGLVREAYGAGAAPQASWLPPALGWAFDPAVALSVFDFARAATLLEQAGWVDAAGDGVRERNGQRLQLTLITNDDNPQRTALAQRAGEQLRALGFDVAVELLPFAVAQEAVLSQRYDLAIVGWEGLG
ncbi:MAG: ABC transporter substrate-binding protein, partial [Caldilineaceae bacterium]